MLTIMPQPDGAVDKFDELLRFAISGLSTYEMLKLTIILLKKYSKYVFKITYVNWYAIYIN